MSQIRITPEQLEEGASFIDTKNGELGDLLTALKSKIDEVASNWEGAAQSAFVASFDEMYTPTLSQTFPEILEGISTQLKTAAQIMRDTDAQLQQAMSKQ